MATNYKQNGKKNIERCFFEENHHRHWNDSVRSARIEISISIVISDFSNSEWKPSTSAICEWSWTFGWADLQVSSLGQWSSLNCNQLKYIFNPFGHIVQRIHRFSHKCLVSFMKFSYCSRKQSPRITFDGGTIKNFNLLIFYVNFIAKQ